MRKILTISFVIFVLAAIIVGGNFGITWYLKHRKPPFISQPTAVGAIVDREHGVAIYSNGSDTYNSHGRHFSKDGYYYGRRWQCVEFVKRYYYDHFNHRMPDGWGHARSFFDPSVTHGQLNQTRGLVQFQNGGQEKPQAGDLLVYVYGEYGHVAIVSKVRQDSIEIVQQNVKGLPRSTLSLSYSQGNWTLQNEKIAGWLRMQG